MRSKMAQHDTYPAPSMPAQSAPHPSNAPPQSGRGYGRKSLGNRASASGNENASGYEGRYYGRGWGRATPYFVEVPCPWTV